MGNDGGSIPTRRELVKEAARGQTAAEIKQSQHQQQEYRWSTDPISQAVLAAPVVSDAAGTLYNKDTILEYLVEGARREDADAVTRGAVRSLKDVVEVRFESAAADGWKCPVTGDRLGPGSKAVYLVPCGHAFSASAIKEVSGERCLTCETGYAANDVIPILPTADTDIARLALRRRTLHDKGLTHSLKKAPGGGKKRKKAAAEADSSGVADGTENGAAEGETRKPDASKANGKTTEGVPNIAINNSATASLIGRVLEEGEAAKKRRKDNDNVRSLFSSRDQAASNANSGDFMTRGYTVPGTVKR